MRDRRLEEIALEIAKFDIAADQKLIDLYEEYVKRVYKATEIGFTHDIND